MFEIMKIKDIVVSMILPSILIPTAGLIVGCDSGPPKETPAEVKKRVETASTLRSFYEKSNGNYDALSADDKAAMNKQTGSEANSKKAMMFMGGARASH